MNIRISIDGKGAWRDNVFAKRLWKSVKYKEAYLRAYASVSETRASIGRYLASITVGGLIRGWPGKRPTRHGATRCCQSRLQIAEAENHSDTPPKLFR